MDLRDVLAFANGAAPALVGIGLFDITGSFMVAFGTWAVLTLMLTYLMAGYWRNI